MKGQRLADDLLLPVAKLYTSDKRDQGTSILIQFNSEMLSYRSCVAPQYCAVMRFMVAIRQWISGGGPCLSPSRQRMIYFYLLVKDIDGLVHVDPR